MEIYKKTFYSEYDYLYFDGSHSSALTIKRYFSNYCGQISIQHCYDNYTGEVFDTISHIDINNSGPLLSNYVDVKKGDYILYSKDCGIFLLEKNLNDYIIDGKYHCRKAFIKSLEYEQFLGNSYSAEKLFMDYKNEIDSLICSPDFNKVIISPKYGGGTIYLSRGDFLVRTDDKILLDIHYLDELDECFKRNTIKELSFSA